MNITSKILCCLIVMSSLMFSCLNSSKENNTWLENEKIAGTYHFLEDYGSKVYLPLDFERYSLSKYQSLLNSLAAKKEFKFETERLKLLRKMEGSLYIFFDKNTGATYTINTMPYYQFDKDHASELLNLIQANNEKISKNSNARFTRITAKYGGNSNQQLFKTIYKVSSKQMKDDIFNTTYIISSNDKTVFVQLITGFETDFDPFIDKMML